MIKKVLGSAFALALLASTAHAADLRRAPAPVYVPPPPPPVVVNWTGAYVGANIGWVGGDWAPSGLVDGDSLGTDPVNGAKANSVIGGLELGVNFQSGSLVWGVEGDISATGLHDSVVPGWGTDDAANSDYKTRWLATFRGRLGFASGAWLLYGTGGLAVGDVQHSFDDIDSSLEHGSSSQTLVGWTAGVGAAYMLDANWSVKLEYLRVDLGSKDLNYGQLDNENYSFKVHPVENIVRVGIDRRF